MFSHLFDQDCQARVQNIQALWSSIEVLVSQFKVSVFSAECLRLESLLRYCPTEMFDERSLLVQNIVKSVYNILSKQSSWYSVGLRSELWQALVEHVRANGISKVATITHPVGLVFKPEYFTELMALFGTAGNYREGWSRTDEAARRLLGLSKESLELIEHSFMPLDFSTRELLDQVTSQIGKMKNLKTPSFIEEKRSSNQLETFGAAKN